MSQAEAWHAALGAVFFSGAAFLVLSVFKVRELLVDAVPGSLKIAISSGIGPPTPGSAREMRPPSRCPQWMQRWVPAANVTWQLWQ